MQLESSPVLFPNIVAPQDLLQVILKMVKFVIILAVVVGDNWDAVIKLIGKGVRTVIDQNNLTEMLLENS